METAVRFGHPILIRISNPNQNPPFKIRCLAAITDLNLNRLTAPFDSRFKDSKLFSNSQQHMSTQNNLSRQSTVDKKQIEEKEEKKLPPPPEKPEPGDCCGSGCVRCVWDVYYEELEDYNKLYKSDSGFCDSKLS